MIKVIGLGALLEVIFLSMVRLGDLRAHTVEYLSLYFSAFAISVLAFLFFRNLDRGRMAALLAFAAMFRATMLASPPTLSPDIYRYIWDSMLWSEGINPYHHLPRDERLAPLQARSEAYAKFTPPFHDVYSVYPPTSQWLFRASYALVGENPIGLKAIFGAFDLAAVAVMWLLLRDLGLQPSALLLYAWNPLPIVEFAGSGHSDSAMIFFVLAAVYLIRRGMAVLGMASLGLAVLNKLFPALFVPFFLKLVRLRQPKALLRGLLALALIVGMLSAPLLDLKAARNIAASVEHYYRWFEFNASVHYLARYIGRELFDVELNKKNGPVLRAIFLAFVAALFLFAKIRDELDLLRSLYHMALAFLLLATTVHPWYALWAFMFVPFSPRASIVCFAATVALSYLTYASTPWRERTWVLYVEYIPLYALIIYENLENLLKPWRRGEGGKKVKAPPEASVPPQ